MKTIRDFLVSTGIGKNEAEVYCTLVEIGTSSVLDISKKVSIHRSNIYDALRKLVKEGLVYEIDTETKLFSARPPESLIDYVKNKEVELKEILNDFRKRYVKKNIAESVQLSRGLFSLREAIFGLLELNKPINVYGIPGDAAERIGPIIKEFHKERIKKKIPMKHIYNSDGVKRSVYLNSFEYTEAKVLPKKYDSSATTMICGNKVVILLWSNEITVIEINSEQMAEPYSNYFEILWKKASVPKK